MHSIEETKELVDFALQKCRGSRKLLAKKTGISEISIWHWMVGKRPISQIYAKKLKLFLEPREK